MERIHLNTHQVAKIVGVSLNTIYRWLREEKIAEPCRDPDNNYRLWTSQNIQDIRLRLVSGSDNQEKA